MMMTAKSIVAVASFVVPSSRALCLTHNDYLNRQAYQSILKRPRNSSLEQTRQHLFFSERTFSGRPTSPVFLAQSEKSELETHRLSLDKIFQPHVRDYLFTTQKNIRNFEWTEKEAEELFESLSSLESNGDTLELNSITVMRKSMTEEEQRKLHKTSNIYDVHDGQQRLISLSLFFAAMRDNLSQFTDCDEDKEVVKEIAGRIYPNKPRADPVCRIQVREKNGFYLQLILSKLDDKGEHINDLFVGESSLPPIRSWKNLPAWDQRILEVYRYFFKRIEELNKDEILDLHDRSTSDVYVLVYEPSDTRIARSIVMGQSKGKNIEPVDEFKGMVCFLSIDDETVQDTTLEKWDDLSDDVTRELLEDACLLVAQVGLQKGRRKNWDVELLEEYLNLYMAEDSMDGKLFFEKKVQPAAKALKEFRDGNVRLIGKSKDIPSLNFLRSATMISISKDIEIVILHFLLELKTHDEGRQLELEMDIKKLESIALWMMLCW